jgi:hypothetical protein
MGENLKDSRYVRRAACPGLCSTSFTKNDKQELGTAHSTAEADEVGGYCQMMKPLHAVFGNGYLGYKDLQTVRET